MRSSKIILLFFSDHEQILNSFHYVSLSQNEITVLLISSNGGCVFSYRKDFYTYSGKVILKFRRFIDSSEEIAYSPHTKYEVNS